MRLNSSSTSRVDQNNSLLYGLPAYQLKRLQQILNSSARLVCGARKYDHISPIMKNLHWLPIEERIDYKILTLTYRCLNGGAPSYLSEILQLKTFSEDQAVTRSADNILQEKPMVISHSQYQLQNCGMV